MGSPDHSRGRMRSLGTTPAFLGRDCSLDKEEEGVEWSLVLLGINCLRVADCVLARVGYRFNFIDFDCDSDSAYRFPILFDSQFRFQCD